MEVLLLIATALPFIAGQDIPFGGLHNYTTNLTDPNVVFAVKAINGFYKTKGDERPRVGVRVVLAQYQTVAGTEYRFKIEVKVDDLKQLCTVDVWSRPWLKGHDALSVVGTPDCRPEIVS